MIHTIKKHSTLLSCIFIGICAAVFRVTNLGLVEFKTDEAVAMLLATKPFFGHAFTQAATASSVGILNPPLFIYLLTPLVAISKDPSIVSGLIGCINVFAIGAFFLIVKKYYNSPVALIASLLLAFAPWPIIFSRKIWEQDFIIPLSIPLLYSLHQILVDKNTKYWWMYTCFGLLLLQIHQAIIFFLAPLTFFVLLKKPKLNWRYILLGAVLGIIPLIPYVMYEFNNNLTDFKLMLTVNDKLHLRSKKVFLFPFEVINTGYFSFIFGKDLPVFNSMYSLLSMSQKIFYIEYLALIFGGIFFWIKNNLLRPIFYATILLSIIYFILRIDPLIHYFIITIPILFLFIAIALSTIIENKNSFIKGLGFLLLGSLLIVSIWFDVAFFQFLNKNNNISGDYGRAYRMSAHDVTITLAKYKNDPRYQEMFISSFIDSNWMQGFLPVPHMIYPENEIKPQLKQLEQRVLHVPVDATAIHELVAYYTYTTPSVYDITYLQKRKQKIPALEPVYHLASDMYLHDNLKKSETSQSPHITFTYPQHWGLQEDTKDALITLDGDNYTVTIGLKKNLCNEQNFCWDNSIGADTHVITQEKTLRITRQDDIKNNTWYMSNYTLTFPTITYSVLVQPNSPSSFTITYLEQHIFPTTDTLTLSIHQDPLGE